MFPCMFTLKAGACDPGDVTLSRFKKAKFSATWPPTHCPLVFSTWNFLAS